MAVHLHSSAAASTVTPMMANSDKKRSNYSYEYSLDVVTDGSEMTEPTVFLSVSRRPAESVPSNDDECDGDAQLTRYAIIGLSEMTARLVADQKLSWASTKAVFCHNNHLVEQNQPGGSGGGIWGLTGILFALQQAGALSLT